MSPLNYYAKVIIPKDTIQIYPSYNHFQYLYERKQSDSLGYHLFLSTVLDQNSIYLDSKNDFHGRNTVVTQNKKKGVFVIRVILTPFIITV